jgi:hypothetical protein
MKPQNLQLVVLNKFRHDDLKVKAVWISGENERPFRSKPNADFGLSRTLISDQTEQPFWLMPNAHFG